MNSNKIFFVTACYAIAMILIVCAVGFAIGRMSNKISCTNSIVSITHVDGTHTICVPSRFLEDSNYGSKARAEN